MSDADYEDGFRDGKNDNLDNSRLNYGADRMNDYERGYIAGGQVASS